MIISIAITFCLRILLKRQQIKIRKTLINEKIQLFHGTRKPFDFFDPRYYNTGEGASTYNGWYFCRTPKGAFKHCSDHLRCDTGKNEGLILHCEVDIAFVDIDIESSLTEPKYEPPIHGVLLVNSSKIKIIGQIQTLDIYRELYCGSQRKYTQ